MVKPPIKDRGIILAPNTELFDGQMCIKLLVSDNKYIIVNPK